MLKFIAVMLFSLGSFVRAEGLIYVATQDTDDLLELYYVNVTNTGQGINASFPLKLNAPQPVGGGVWFGIPIFGNPGEIFYAANQDDAAKMELYIVSISTPGASTKINADLTADQEIESGLPCPDGTKILYTVRTISTDTVDLYVVTIGNPGVATKLNPALGAGHEVGEFVATADCAKVVYGAQINSDAEELFVTDLNTPGVATKADGVPAGTDHVIDQLSLSINGAKAFWIGGPSEIGKIKNLMTVALNDLGNIDQVNADFLPGSQISDYEVSGDTTTVVYRLNVSFLETSNVYVVDLTNNNLATMVHSKFAPGMADQVNPDWLTGGLAPFGGFESFVLLDDGAAVMYNGPLDDADENELYETALDNLQVTTKLNDLLDAPAMGGPAGVSIFGRSPDGNLVVYSEGFGGVGGINVVDRSSPGNAVQPFLSGAEQRLGLLATFSNGSDLIATVITTVDGMGFPVKNELHVGKSTVQSSNIRVNADLADGIGVIFSFWVPPVLGDSDGDGIPDSEDNYPLLPFAPSEQLLRRSTDNRWFVYVLSFEDNTNLVIENKGIANMSRSPAYQTVSRSDFDGDGIADVLVRDMVGTENGRWVMYTLVGPTVTSSGFVDLTRNADWQVAASDDFDGDGKADLLLRNTADGRWLLYLLDSQTVMSQGILAMSTDTTNTVIGTGDFNNDGRNDLLLRRADGSWLMYQLDGLSAPVEGMPAMTSNLAFTVQSLADFNGDGNTDVLLRRNDGRWFLYEMNGSMISASGSPAMTENVAFSLVSDSDFNGDGTADALLRRTNGRWFLYSLDGVSILNEGALDMTRNPSFELISTDDFNGDGKADALLRRGDGRWVLYALDGDGPTILGQGIPDMTRNEDWVPQLD